MSRLHRATEQHLELECFESPALVRINKVGKVFVRHWVRPAQSLQPVPIADYLTSDPQIRRVKKAWLIRQRSIAWQILGVV